MIFRTPELKEVFDSITNNNDLINNLNENDYLLNKKNIYENYEKTLADNLLPTIYTSNKDMMYNLAEILYDNSEYIKATSVDLIIDNKFKFTEIAEVFGQTELLEYTYRLIFYSYKYCYTSSFFQNNVSKFLPEYDYTQIKDHEITNAFTDALMKEFDKIDYTISKCAEFVDFDKIPFEYISYLTQLLGFDKKDIYTSNEKQYREICKCIIDIYRIKGTNYSFQLLFNFLGFDVSIYEYYFDRRFYYSSDGGNAETSEYSSKSKEFYLTVTNPILNCNSTFTRNEVVTKKDITTQYSLTEFEYLAKKYGPECVLGYCDYYTEDGVKKQYTGKIYKYFKTNYVYYNIGLTNGNNPTSEQISAINKYLEFLTPAFIMKNLTISVYTGDEEETIKFDGDGEKDESGNPVHEPTSFELLDGEDWNNSNKDIYTTFIGGIEGYYSPYANENEINKYVSKLNSGSITKSEFITAVKKYGFIEYKNSLNEAYFRQPIGYTDIYIDTNRFLGDGDGSRKPVFRRIYSYKVISTDENGKETITYHWSEPPKESYYGQTSDTIYKTNSTTDFNGSSDSIKEKIKEAGTGKEIDFYISPSGTYKTINDFIDSGIFSSFKYTKCSNAGFIKIREKTSKISTSIESTVYNIYKNYKEIYNIVNVQEADSISNYRFTENKIINTLSSFYEDNIEAKDLMKKIYYGCYILTYASSSNSVTVYLYKYEMQLGKTSSSLSFVDNSNIYKYFDWGISKFNTDNNGSITSTDSDYVINSDFDTFSNFSSYITKRNSTTALKSTLDTKTLYYIRNEASYYRLVKNSTTDVFVNKSVEYSFNKALSDNKILCINPSSKNLFEFAANNGYTKTSDTSYDLSKTYYEYIPFMNNDGKYAAYTLNPSKENLYELSDSYSLSSDKTYDSSKTYYYISAKEGGSINKIFNTVSEAEKYFNDKYSSFKKFNGAEFYCNGYSIDSSAETSLMNGLYSYTLDKIRPGMLIYSEADDDTRGKLYEITGITPDSIKEINFDGNIKVSDNIAKIYDYDEYWGGYDEYADRDDLITYNNYHSIDYYGFSGEYYKRPTKYYCDYIFDNSSIAQKIINEIVSKTADRMNDYELYGWDKTTVTGKGIVSKIEDIIEFDDNAALDYYSSASDFFVDYYNFVICEKDGYFDGSSIKGDLTDTELRAKFNCALYNLKIIKDFISTKTYKLSYVYSNNGISNEGLDIGYNESTCTYDTSLDTSKKNTIIINISVLDYMKKALFDIAYKSGQLIKFSNDSSYPEIAYGSTTYYDSTNNIFYISSYSMLTKANGFTFCNLSKWNIDMNGTVYTLKYNIEFIDDGKHYSQDYYGNYYDIYNNFANLYDIFISGAKPSSGSESISTSSEAKNFTFDGTVTISSRKEKIDDFLKTYYYTEVLKRYREKFIEEDNPDIVMDNNSSDKVYPKLIEKINGKAGKLSLGRTLLTSTISNGKTDDIVKIPFIGYNINQSSSDEYTVTLYVCKRDFTSRTGIVLNKELAEITMYYASLLYAYKNPTKAAEITTAIKSAIESAYSKIVTVINPKFFFEQNSNRTETIYLNTFNSSVAKDIETEHDEISVGILPSSSVSSVLSSTSESERAKEFATIIKQNDPTSWLKKVADSSKYYSFSFTINGTVGSSDLLNNLSGTEDEIISKLDSVSKAIGYFEMHNLKPELIDNYVSIPQSRDWVDTDANSNKNEFISFGDDRNIDISIKNDYFLKKDSSSNTVNDEDVFEKYTSAIETAESDTNNEKGIKSVLSVYDNNHTIGEYTYYSRNAVQNQKANDSTKEDGYVLYDEKQSYKIEDGKYKKNYINKIINNLNNVVLETDNVNLANITDIVLLCYIVYTSFTTSSIYEKFSIKNKKILSGRNIGRDLILNAFNVSKNVFNIMKRSSRDIKEDIYIFRAVFLLLRKFNIAKINEKIFINAKISGLLNSLKKDAISVIANINAVFSRLLRLEAKIITENVKIEKTYSTGRTFKKTISNIYNIASKEFTNRLLERNFSVLYYIEKPIEAIIFIINTNSINIKYNLSGKLASIVVSFGSIGVSKINYAIEKNVAKGLRNERNISNSFTLGKAELSIQ